MKNEIPLISVIVPVYNVEKYLSQCIYSILNQTYSNLEIILVNDGSTDNSYEQCLNFKRQFNNIEVVNKANGGLSSARNVGINHARGKYISFVDSDDTIDSNMIQTLYDYITEYKAEISACGYKMIYSNKVIDIVDGNEVKVYSKSEALFAMLKVNNLGMIVCNKLFKRDLFKNVRFPEGQHFEDINTTYKLIDLANKVIYIPKCLYNYLQRNDSINGQNFKSAGFNNHIYDLYYSVQELEVYFENHFFNYKRIYLPYLNLYYLRVANQLLIYKKDTELLSTIKQKITRDISVILKCQDINLEKKIQFLLFTYIKDLYRVLLLALRRK
ncbi:glycosyltransferase [Faecalicoccus acidiformans]|uniref:glycosyltransferase family 2 protein n=1 Tax=Faecalicoccus acidiformans TaxID=915173 RepID=UPI0025A4A31D|nr:glycosyltransferase [Faecalicoccus acidiformans]MDM8203642.1 glycosyltransferase [Faecalicoccus acidiformans]